MPASMTGCSIPSSSVRRVRMSGGLPRSDSSVAGDARRSRRGDRSAGGGGLGVVRVNGGVPAATGPAEGGGDLPMVAFRAGRSYSEPIVADVGEVGVSVDAAPPVVERDHRSPAVADPRRAAARHVAGRARPDHRLDRAADHRGRPARWVAPGLGRHRLPAGLDGVDAAVGQARRPVRAEDLLPGRDRDLRHRFGAVRASATP